MRKRPGHDAGGGPSRRTQIVKAARDARKALVQVIEQCEKNRREVLELNDGGELDPERCRAQR